MQKTPPQKPDSTKADATPKAQSATAVAAPKSPKIAPSIKAAVQNIATFGDTDKIETDETSNPSVSTLYKIAEGLELTIADILGTEQVTVKRVVPDEHADWRKKLATAFKGKELDPDILSAMLLLRNRKATKADDIEHWKFLYTSIENSFKG